jgi:hypothetical protein
MYHSFTGHLLSISHEEAPLLFVHHVAWTTIISRSFESRQMSIAGAHWITVQWIIFSLADANKYREMVSIVCK